MTDDTEAAPALPEPTPDAARAGQALERAVPLVHSAVPADSRISELPRILLDGAREAVHSELTWKLISKIASQGEDERDALRLERDTARAQAEEWRSKNEDAQRDLTDLSARWDSVNTLTNAQSLLYVVGGVFVGPVVQDALAGRWVPQSAFFALFGLAAIAAAYVLGRIGPRR